MNEINKQLVYNKLKLLESKPALSAAVLNTRPIPWRVIFLLHVQKERDRGLLSLYNPNNGLTVVLEVKGKEDEKTRANYEAAKRWCNAVSNWNKMGKWCVGIFIFHQQHSGVDIIEPDGGCLRICKAEGELDK